MTRTVDYNFIENPSLTGHVGEDLSCVRASTALEMDSDGKLWSVANNIPRFFGYSNCENLLNTVDLSAADFQVQNCTKTTGQTDSQGGSTAALLTDSVGSNDFTLRDADTWDGNGLANLVGKTNVWEIKAGTKNFAYIALRRSNTSFTSRVLCVNLTTGEIVVTGSTIIAGTAGTKDLGNGWWRVWATFTGTGAANDSTYVGIANDDGTSGVYTGDGTGTIYVGRPQCQNLWFRPVPKTPDAFVAPGTVTRSHKDGDGAALSPEPLGIFADKENENLALHSEDASNAAWVKTNMTVETDEYVDPHGDIATTGVLTATAANATILQTVTASSAIHVYQCRLSRLTGSGDVQMTIDGGSTWHTVTIGAPSTYVGDYVVNWITATLANPEFGIRLVTSGDQVIFTCSMLEQSGRPHMYVGPTTASAVTANDDDISHSNMVDYNSEGAGTLYGRGSRLFDNEGGADGVTNTHAGGYLIVLGGTGAGAERITIGATPLDAEFVGDEGATLWTLETSPSRPPDDAFANSNVVTMVGTWADNDVDLFVNGGFVQADGNTNPGLPTLDDDVHIGSNWGGNGSFFEGGIARIFYEDEKVSDKKAKAWSGNNFSAGASGLGFKMGKMGMR